MTKPLDTSKPAASLAALNRHLHRLGMPAEIDLVRGSAGYYYFTGGKPDTVDDTARWYTSSVYVHAHHHLSIAQWWRAFEQLAEGGRRRFEDAQERREVAECTDDAPCQATGCRYCFDVPSRNGRCYCDGVCQCR